MKNPYEVLGVPENASEEQIKAAYRALVKKYHPDNYSGTPLADVANEKMQEINEAYDAITTGKYRSSSSYGGYGYSNNAGYGQYANTGYSNSEKEQQIYQQVRASIQYRRFDEAESILNTVPSEERRAEWNYLKGQIAYNKGWFDRAAEYFTVAYNINPNDPEYRKAYANMSSTSAGGFRTSKSNKSDCDFCGTCEGLLCADCCCECMGGDLIPCC
ncbi:MAG: J domain-containing protein [Clostridia bacterium]|nr:J domain-containing protein [Clostridia bacterium]